jgi:hypothetical protein
VLVTTLSGSDDTAEILAIFSPESWTG